MGGVAASRSTLQCNTHKKDLKFKHTSHKRWCGPGKDNSDTSLEMCRDISICTYEEVQRQVPKYAKKTWKEQAHKDFT